MKTSMLVVVLGVLLAGLPVGLPGVAAQGELVGYAVTLTIDRLVVNNVTEDGVLSDDHDEIYVNYFLLETTDRDHVTLESQATYRLWGVESVEAGDRISARDFEPLTIVVEPGNRVHFGFELYDADGDLGVIEDMITGLNDAIEPEHMAVAVEETARLALHMALHMAGQSVPHIDIPDYMTEAPARWLDGMLDRAVGWFQNLNFDDQLGEENWWVAADTLADLARQEQEASGESQFSGRNIYLNRFDYAIHFTVSVVAVYE